MVHDDGNIRPLKLTTSGVGTGMANWKEILALLELKKDDRHIAVATPSGHLLTSDDPEIAKQLKLGREIMAEYRETFHALAK